MDLRIPQGKPGKDGDDGDDGISPTLRLTEQGIEVSYDKGSTWSLLVPISEFHITNNIANEYINNPDEEDITVIDDKLKFKDKEYNLSEFSGLSRTYLRKNIIGSKNVLTYDMFNSSSTIYHIQYNYDLDGKTIVIPSDSILLFEGGSFYNGTIVGNHTTILSNNKCFESITINATADVRADGADPSGNPIYKVDFGIPRGSNGIDGDDGVSAGFGEPTASAEAVASDVAPSVVVTATGTNTSS